VLKRHTDNKRTKPFSPKSALQLAAQRLGIRKMSAWRGGNVEFIRHSKADTLLPVIQGTNALSEQFGTELIGNVGGLEHCVVFLRG
jgi:hypothetical protein